MAVIARSVSPSAGHMRQFDMRRDLSAVADLVELCFADTLDPDGERYLQDMRSTAQNTGLLNLANSMADPSSMPLTGFVWEEAGRVVGNLSLIPYTVQSQHYYLIANVAVHPNFRRQGIGRILTATAVDQVRRSRVKAAWLHVREDNDPAIHLYRTLGFVERARRTTWHSLPQDPFAARTDPTPFTPGLALGPRLNNQWQIQREWLKIIYPPELTWHLPYSLYSLDPGLLGFLYRAFMWQQTRHWSAVLNGRLLATLSWQSCERYADCLWLAISDKIGDDSPISSLLAYARRRLSRLRPLTLDFPAHIAEEPIRSAGFTPHQTLLWMSINI